MLGNWGWGRLERGDWTWPLGQVQSPRLNLFYLINKNYVIIYFENQINYYALFSSGNHTPDQRPDRYSKDITFKSTSYIIISHIQKPVGTSLCTCNNNTSTTDHKETRLNLIMLHTKSSYIVYIHTYIATTHFVQSFICSTVVHVE